MLCGICYRVQTRFRRCGMYLPTGFWEITGVDYRFSTSYGSMTTSMRGPLMLEGSPLMIGLRLALGLSPRSPWYFNQLPYSLADVDLHPQYLIINLGMSSNFGFVDLEHLPFPVVMSVDWIRVYQQTDSINYTCDPPEFPTQAYINTYIDAYTSQCPLATPPSRAIN